jgi:hypothetical protein
MMPETVIKLRRSVFGLRETRSQGAYCAVCGVGWSVDSALAPARRPAATFARFWNGVRDMWPAWRLSGPARPGRFRAGGVTAYDPLPLAR